MFLSAEVSEDSLSPRSSTAGVSDVSLLPRSITAERSDDPLSPRSSTAEGSEDSLSPRSSIAEGSEDLLRPRSWGKKWRAVPSAVAFGAALLGNRLPHGSRGQACKFPCATAATVRIFIPAQATH